MRFLFFVLAIVVVKLAFPIVAEALVELALLVIETIIRIVEGLKTAGV